MPTTPWESHIKSQYGILPHKYKEMQIAQDNRCAICGDLSPEGKKLNIDHNHKTGKIRELLCRNCNLALGLLKDSFEVVEKAFLYLKKHYDPDSDPKSLYQRILNG